MSVARKVARNTIVQLVSKVITTLTSLGIVALITRQLGVQGYGEYVAVMAYSQFFAIFADLGTNIYFIKQLSSDPEHEREHINAMLGLRILTGLLIIVVAGLVMLFLPYSPLVRLAILIYLGAVFAQSMNSLFVAVLQAKLEMHFAAFTEIIGRLAVLFITMLAVSLDKGLLWITGAVLVGAVINVFWTYFYAKRLAPISVSWQPKEWGKVIRGAMVIGITVILSFVYFKIDSVLLSVLPISGRTNAVELGIYGSAYKVLEIMIVIPGIFLGNIFPLMSLYLSDQQEKIQGLVQKAFDVMAMVGLPVTALLLVASSPIITLIAGDGFAPAAVPLRILALGILCSFFSAIFTYLAMAASKQKSLAWLYGGVALFNLGANLIFIPRYSYMAAATTTFVTELLVLIGAVVICKRYVELRLDWTRFTKIFIVSLLIALGLWAAKSISFAWTLLAAIAVYAVLIVRTGVFTLEELKQIARRN